VLRKRVWGEEDAARELGMEKGMLIEGYYFIY
jgi:hypothetical protein